MMNSETCFVKLEMEILTIYVLIWLEVKKVVKIVFSMKAKKHKLKALFNVNLVEVVEKKT